MEESIDLKLGYLKGRETKGLILKNKITKKYLIDLGFLLKETEKHFLVNEELLKMFNKKREHFFDLSNLDYLRGWVAGVYDQDGIFITNSPPRITISKKYNPTLTRVLDYLNIKSYTYSNVVIKSKIDLNRFCQIIPVKEKINSLEFIKLWVNRNTYKYSPHYLYKLYTKLGSLKLVAKELNESLNKTGWIAKIIRKAGYKI